MKVKFFILLFSFVILNFSFCVEQDLVDSNSDSFLLVEDRNNLQSNNEVTLYDIYKDDKWGFIGKKFDDELYEEYTSSIDGDRKFLLSLFGAALVGFSPVLIGAFLGEMYDIQHDIREKKDRGNAFHAIGALMSLCFGIPLAMKTYKIIYKKLSEYIKQRIMSRNEKILGNFLNNWPEYKLITPESLHELFDKLYVQYMTDESFDIHKHTYIIFDIRNQLIDKHKKYYEKYVQRNQVPKVILTPIPLSVFNKK